MNKLADHIFWIDFVEGDSLMDRIHDLEQPGTQDELGLGRIRDYFADSFFPGTTTVMTRARYFLFIPAIYYFYERRDARVALDEIKRKQNELRERLEAYRKKYKGKENADSYGIIGSVSKERLKRWPDSIYWNGITRLGIFTQKDWSRSYYLNVINRREKRVYDDDNNAQDDPAQLNAWDFRFDEFKNLYFSKDNIFKDEIPLELYKPEALYLKEKLSSQTESLYQYLINQKRECGEGIFWEIPGLPRSDDVKDARNFSFFGKGLWLSYYFLLSRKKKNGKDDYFYDLFKKWYQATKLELKRWDYSSFLTKLQERRYPHRPVINKNNRSDLPFLTNTYQNIFKSSSNISTVLHKNEIYIKERELFVKGSVRAKLSNDKAMEEWNGKIEVSEDRLFEYDYRWQRPVRAIINDVIRGLKRV